MNYGFVIDNRKCIGCHACTVACKAEHDVPVGVNRTWVKQTEKGTFPNTRRVFSVLRCNHCEVASCVTICPVEALYTREDGIVDFNNNRCIGCKSCMQACPYDALYIDPETRTAAKCNYCAHRVDIGLEPACVNVCPEHAIISGDLDNPDTEIAQLIGREQVTVRKPEKGNVPNLYYINGDEASITPNETVRDEQYFWNSQQRGVGHFAKYAEKLAAQNDPFDLTKMLVENNNDLAMTYSGDSDCSNGSCDSPTDKALQKSDPRRIYDTPDKGILWGWEVSGYVLTKAISSGVFLTTFMAVAFNITSVSDFNFWAMIALSLVFLGATGILLIMDLDQPKRFAYVLLRPQWNSWLVKGGYSISIFGGLVTLLALFYFFELDLALQVTFWAGAFFALVVAGYTAFLFAQAKGRDFWQSPTLVFHMLAHAFMAGGAALAILNVIVPSSAGYINYLEFVMLGSLIFNLFIILVELTITHPTEDAKKAAHMITHGRYKRLFWTGSILAGNVLPILLLLSGKPLLSGVAGVLILIGIYFTEKIWIEAPQRIPLS
ncbi:MAG TPA: 4Fe-4S ferredoxin [Flavobacteriales bacterium]|jgi:Fe-S-cluster-containing dehydrogenase component/formate-dependent nitrite reductase membrane component NrfD|nr:4Fe-4S ferredoxin [Flavobacteriales bacterium]